MSGDTLLSPEEWERVGTGRQLEFFATDPEIQRFLHEGLPADPELYALVSVKYDVSDTRLEHYSVTQLDGFVAAVHQGSRDFWIVEAHCRPGVEAWLNDEQENRLAFLTVNGFCLIQPCAVFEKRLDSARIAVIDKARNGIGKVIHHTKRRQIYVSLAKHIRRNLLYTAIKVDVDGTQEESAEPLITAGVASEIQAGIPYTMALGVKSRGHSRHRFQT
jgi:hypothetical protein